MKNVKFRIVMYVNLALLLVGVVGNVYGYSLTRDYQFILNTSGIILSLAYLIYGCKKDAAGFFMCYMVFLTIKEGFALSHMIFEEQVPTYALIIVGVMMLAYAILAFGKDLGKKKSFTLCGVIVLLSALTLIAGLCFTPVVFNEGTREGLTLAIFNATRVLMSVILCIMVYAKYEDKYARGSK